MVGVANVVKASALVVKIAPAWDRVPAVASTKMDVGMTPPTEGGPIVQQDQLIQAELGLYENLKK